MSKSYSKIRHIQNSNMLLESRLLTEGSENIGPFSVDLDGGPSAHEWSKSTGQWQDYNAWDLFAPIGTKVYSYTNGIVTKIKEYSNQSNLFGLQITIGGTDGYPDIFYTHLKNAKIKVGSVVKVNDYIGEICEGHSSPHVHIALEPGYHLRDYIKKIPIKKIEIPPADLEKMYPPQESTRVNQNFQNKFK